MTIWIFLLFLHCRRTSRMVWFFWLRFSQELAQQGRGALFQGRERASLRGGGGYPDPRVLVQGAFEGDYVVLLLDGFESGLRAVHEDVYELCPPMLVFYFVYLKRQVGLCLFLLLVYIDSWKSV